MCIKRTEYLSIVGVLLDLEESHAEGHSDVVGGRCKPIAGRVDERLDSYGDLAFGSLVTASAPIVRSLHACKVSNLRVLGVFSRRLQLTHHELILGRDGDNSIALGLLCDLVVLDIKEVEVELMLPLCLPSSRAHNSTLSVGVFVLEHFSMHSMASRDLKLHLQTEFHLSYC
jgi:hypothetical protein